jgi:hypothetical protein
MNRRIILQALTGAVALPLPTWVSSRSAPSANPIRIAATWRGPEKSSTPYAGVLEIDLPAQSVSINWSVALPSRAHGLYCFSDGSTLVTAVRPGQWLMHIDAHGQVLREIANDENNQRHFTGHVTASVDEQWVFTAETDSRDDTGWITVRDRNRLEAVAQWPSYGIEPHHLLLDRNGQLLVANGGILRTHEDRKRDLNRMDSSLAHIDTRSGALLGQWRLADKRLSLRHLAWSQADAQSGALLGVGMQAEHDAEHRRHEAPVLATWDGHSLAIPTYASDAAGYAGDITPAFGGGFVVSNARVNSALWWHPNKPGQLTLVAKMQEAYALGSSPPHSSPIVVIAAARGVGLWHPQLPPTMLPWPAPMVLDNHWFVLG